MKDLYFQSLTTLKFDSPVVNHHFLLRYLPASFGGQRIVSATLILTPGVPYTLSRDGFGNLTETGNIGFPHVELNYEVCGRAMIDENKRMPEPLHPIYKYPSTFTKPTPEMEEFVKSLPLTGSTLDKALQLAHAVFNYMSYVSGVTSINTTAAEAFAQRKGVCQDFAHIFISLSRLAGIPARYANGIPVGQGESHAWTEVYADGCWTGIDPTRDCLTHEDYIRFGVGRDFRDCAMEQGIFFGRANQTSTIYTQVTEK